MDMWVNSYGWLKELMVSQVFRLLEGGILCEKQKNRRCQMFSIYVASLIMLRVNSPYNSLSS